MAAAKRGSTKDNVEGALVSPGLLPRGPWPSPPRVESD